MNTTTVVNGIEFTTVSDEVAVLLKKKRFVKCKSVKEGDWILTGETPKEFKAVEIKAVLSLGGYLTWLNTEEIGPRGLTVGWADQVCSVKGEVMAKELGR